MLPQIDHTKSRAIKKVLNTITPSLLKLIREREPTFPTSRMIAELFEDLEKKLLIERQRNKSYDRNFMVLLEATKRCLTFLMDNDPVYRRWAEYAMVALTEKVNAYNGVV